MCASRSRAVPTDRRVGSASASVWVECGGVRWWLLERETRVGESLVNTHGTSVGCVSCLVTRLLCLMGWPL